LTIFAEVYCNQDTGGYTLWGEKTVSQRGRENGSERAEAGGDRPVGRRGVLLPKRRVVIFW